VGGEGQGEGVYFHGKKQENLFAPLRLCVSARDILVAAIRIRRYGAKTVDFASRPGRGPVPRQSLAMIPARVFSGLNPPSACVPDCRSLVVPPRDDTGGEARGIRDDTFSG
jgi:hypothetical protein